jgi:hypothetical protein
MLARCVVLCLVAITAIGCFSPHYVDGNLHCAAAKACPDGFHCAVDNRCWKNGDDPPRPPARLSVAGGGAVGVQGTGARAHSATISIGQWLAPVSQSSPASNHTFQSSLLQTTVTK